MDYAVAAVQKEIPKAFRMMTANVRMQAAVINAGREGRITVW